MNGNITAENDSPTLARLQDQIEWCDRKSLFNEQWYKRLKLLTLITAAMIPAAAQTGPAVISSVLGALVLVIEGVQHLNQYQFLWTQYRHTSETLKSEKFLYLAGAGIYSQAPNPIPVLAERVEMILSGDKDHWSSHQQTAVAASK